MGCRVGLKEAGTASGGKGRKETFGEGGRGNGKKEEEGLFLSKESALFLFLGFCFGFVVFGFCFCSHVLRINHIHQKHVALEPSTVCVKSQPTNATKVAAPCIIEGRDTPVLSFSLAPACF